MEPDEGLEKVNMTLKICSLYRDTFFIKKKELVVYFKEKPVVPWNFAPSLIFSRLDRFISQLRMIVVRDKHLKFLCMCVHTFSGGLVSN